MANTVVSIQETQKSASLNLRPRFTSRESRLLQAASWRLKLSAAQRALASDVNTPFNSITMPGASQSAMSEFFAFWTPVASFDVG